MPARLLLLLLLPLLTAGCLPKGVDIPMAYTTRANASPESLPCAKRKLAALGFQFVEEPDLDDEASATRVTRRGTQTRLQEVVRLELSGEGNRRVLELTLGISRGRGALEPDATPLSIGSLSAPSRQSINEVDDVMARCQRSPLSGGHLAKAPALRTASGFTTNPPQRKIPWLLHTRVQI